MALLPDTISGYSGGEGIAAGVQAGLGSRRLDIEEKQKKQQMFLDQYASQKKQSLDMITNLKKQIDTDYELKRRQVDKLGLEEGKKAEMYNALDAKYRQNLEGFEQSKAGIYDSLERSIITPMTQLGYLPQNQAEMDRQQFASIQGLRPSEQAYIDALGPAEKAGQEALVTGESYTYWMPNEQKYRQIPKTDSAALSQAQQEGGFEVKASVQSATAGGLTKPVETDVQKKLINVEESLGRIREIRAGFKPEFLQVGGRISQLVQKMGEKFGVAEIPKEDKKTFEDYRKFGQKSLMFLNEEIHRLTGAQLSQFEAKRIRGSLPDFGEGVFSGNSPTEFMANLDSTEGTLQAVAARYRFLLENGVLQKNQEMTDDIAENYPLDSFKVPTKTPSTNEQGWKLYTDANGNKAYVGPNGEIKEVK